METIRLLLVGGREIHADVLHDMFLQHAPEWRLKTVCDIEQECGRIFQNDCDVVLLNASPEVLSPALELCRRVRAAGVPAGVAMLSVQATLNARLAALDAGADDFLVRERLTGLELCDRIRVAYMRSALYREELREQSVTVPREGLAVDHRTGTILMNGKVVELTRHQRLLLLRLSLRAGAFVTAAELCSCSGIQSDPEYKNLRNQVSRLRKRLARAGSIVEGVPRHGYRLRSDVSSTLSLIGPEVGFLGWKASP